MVDFTATDACGNATVTSATFTIVDTELPQFTAIPVDRARIAKNCPTKPLPWTTAATLSSAKHGRLLVKMNAAMASTS